MDKKKKNLQEMHKLGFSQKTLSLMTESQIDMILEKIKKKEAKEVEEKKSYVAKPEEVKAGVPIPPGTSKLKMNPDGSAEFTEGKKKKKKYNPWAVCTASVGRENKKKYEDCVMGVKKKLKEGKSPYEYIIESKIEEIVENNLSPKLSKSEILRIIAEKQMMMKKPIGKMTSMTMVEDNEVAPAKPKEKEKVREKPSHPGRKEREQPNPKPRASSSEMESKKSEIITAIFNLIDKENK